MAARVLVGLCGLALVFAGACSGGGGTNATLPDAGPGGCTRVDDCDDGDPCTIETCEAASCVSTPMSCDDGNKCTGDRCVAGKCEFTPLDTCCLADADCNDGNKCTVDKCQSGTCANTKTDATCCNSPADCDDSDACTLDDCNGGKCNHIFSPGPECCKKDIDCLDGNACTTDKCVGGKCQYTVSGCCTTDEQCAASANACQTGRCDNGGCVFDWKPGCCVGDADCDDEKPCTLDSCKDATCVHTAAEACCTMDADCAVDDPCKIGACVIPDGAAKGECVVSLKETPECCVATQLDLRFDDGSDPGLVIEPLYDAGGPSWQVDAKRFVSSPKSLYFGNPATHSYDHGQLAVGGRATTGEADLDKTIDPILRFQLWMQTEVVASSDVLSIFVVVGGSETLLWSTAQEIEFSNTNGVYVPVEIPLSGYAGKKVRFVLEFDTHNGFANAYEGVYIDDFAVVGQCP